MMLRATNSNGCTTSTPPADQLGEEALDGLARLGKPLVERLKEGLFPAKGCPVREVLQALRDEGQPPTQAPRAQCCT